MEEEGKSRASLELEGSVKAVSFAGLSAVGAGPFALLMLRTRGVVIDGSGERGGTMGSCSRVGNDCC